LPLEDSEAALLLSMTGFGEARRQDQRWTIVVELRTVNNRHFKLSAKIPDSFAMMEPALEQLVREKVRRGTVQLNLRVDRPRRPEDYRVNLVALTSYRDQLKSMRGFNEATLDLAQLLVLPGVVEDFRSPDQQSDQDLPEIARVVTEALSTLQSARAVEGRAMADELIALAGAMSSQLSLIAERSPQVIQNHQKRITERVSALLKPHDVTIEPKDLVREVAILADRSDISEEIVRLRAHLTQFFATVDEGESSGRKLEFISQEMGREVNTIGSKAGDVEISRSVVEVKALLEKIRELVQNVE
jgi:uncharacterized protein (TIGR00255 family)